MCSRNKTSNNTCKSKIHVIQVVEEEDGFKELIFEKYPSSKSTHDSIMRGIYYLCIVSAMTISGDLKKNFPSSEVGQNTLQQ